MKLIIPTAKLITPELQNIGKIPAILYPINQNISFDFFRLKYELTVSQMNVVCCEKAEKVRETLSRYKLSVKLNLIELDELKDLGWSIYNGLTDADKDVTIHFADTIVMDSLPSDVSDFFCSASEYMSETWTFYDLNDGEISFISDKKSPATSFSEKPARKSFFIGVFKFSDGAYFKSCLKLALENPSENMDSFYSALTMYSRRYKLSRVEVKDWFDIGHAQKYFETRIRIEARTFNHIETDHNRGILKKTSKDIEKFTGEIKWYLKLPADLEYVRPRIFDYSLHYSNPYVAMEYYSYRTLHELFLYADLSVEQWRKIFQKIKFVTDDFSRYKLTDENLNDSLKSMYCDKTISRLNELRKKPEFEKIFDKPIRINGKKYPSLEKISDELKKIIPEILYNVDSFSIIHGDLCFPNIMIDDNLNFIKLIDPRGKFGSYDIYGDRRYEIAKLLHSIEGKYDFIIKDLFNLEVNDENDFGLKILESARGFEITEIFTEVFGEDLKNELQAVRLIEALLFLSMIPMHKENLNHQYAMLCTGVKIFCETVNTGC